jgi:hypothetical protein
MLLGIATISTTNPATAGGTASATILKWLRTCKALSIIHFLEESSKRVFGGVEVNARIVNFEVLASASQVDCFKGIYNL